jgi:DNA-binding CsgD family transcriptional regulator
VRDRVGRRSVVVMAGVAERIARRLLERCYMGLDATSLQAEFLDTLQRVVPFDAAFCATVDPTTLLFTGATLREIPWEATPRFLANEFLEDDVNKFRSLAAGRSPVDWLDRATEHDRAASARYRDIMAPLGLGDELRAAFRAGGACWGFLCVHREDGPRGFTPEEARLVARLSKHVGEGLRRSLLAAAEKTTVDPDGPGVLVVAEDGSLVATTEAGERWMWELEDTELSHERLTLAVQSVLARLVGNQTENPPIAEPSVRVRTRSGRWVAVHAAPMAGLGENRHVAVVIEPAKPAELAPIILLAHGLTRREGQVAQLALQGRTNKRVARDLRISEHTVEDHLKAIFAKVGVSSRGELAATIFAEHYTH